MNRHDPVRHHPALCVTTTGKETGQDARPRHLVHKISQNRKMETKCQLSSGKAYFWQSCYTGSPGKDHLPLTQHFRLVVLTSTASRLQLLANWNFGKTYILHHSPDNGQTTGFRCESIDLISALSHVTEEALNRVRGANIAMHHLWKRIKREQMVFVLTQTAHRLWIALPIFGECSPPS